MSGNLSAIAEYRTREREFRKRVRDFEEVTTKRDEKRALYEGYVASGPKHCRP